MSKISMFGVSSSGKTCFLYAMAQVLRNGVRHGDDLVQIISNNVQQQGKLNDGYMKLANHQWPQKSDQKDPFDFKVNMQCNGCFGEVIPSLEILDYRGGILQDMSETGKKKLNELLDSFRGSSAIIFIIDGQTLINAMDPDDRDVRHRDNIDILEQLSSRMQIELVENIFIEYKRVETDIPPILIAISKGDIFASKYEEENGIRLIKEKLLSIFSVGSNLYAGITIMSLGEGLGKDDNGALIGTLTLSQDYNIHIPIIFGIYADLSYKYEETTDPAERDGIIILLATLRKLMAGKVQIFKNGRKAIAV